MSITALCHSLSLSSISSSANAVRRAVVADDALAAESLDKDEVPQDLIDMTARAADDIQEGWYVHIRPVD